MFTGIVEVIGTVTSLEALDTSAAGGGGTSLTISGAAPILADAREGDSICVNGTCLTVTQLSAARDSFKVGVAPETLRRTNLGHLRAAPAGSSSTSGTSAAADRSNTRVNLEPALQATTRLGGHIVQGHVDTVATIVRKRADGNAVVFRLRPREQDVLRYIVEKGFVALDGASLTVTAEGRGDDGQEGHGDEEGGQEQEQGAHEQEQGRQGQGQGQGWFEVMLIAYTQSRIVMAGKDVGQEVNVEVDMVGKYVEKSVRAYFEGSADAGGRVLEKMVARMVEERLRQAGVAR